MIVAALVMWPVIAGFIGAAAGRASYDWMFAYLSRTPSWRRFDRCMRRRFRSARS